jgi:hypothetical protein
VGPGSICLGNSFRLRKGSHPVRGHEMMKVRPSEEVDSGVDL